jgi:hypothetical protein
VTVSGRHPLITLLLLWAGVLLGAAFLAVPVSFMAEGLDRALGLSVARSIFQALDRVELAFAVGSAAIALLMRPPRLVRITLGLAWLVLALRSWWLLPALSARTETILNGSEPPASLHHAFSSSLAIAQLILLLITAWLASRPRSGG